jgi:hypothetical protein
MDIILTTLSGFQLASGLTTHALQSPINYSKWSEPGWCLTCWEILDSHTIHLEAEQFTTPPLLRENDRSLVQLLSDLNHYDGWKLREINGVRIYMHVTTTSDITTACGTRLNRDRYDIDEPLPVENTKYKWPLQAKPGKRAWELWRNTLHQLTHSMADIRLPVPLGEWTAGPRQHFTWFTKTNHQTLIHVTNGQALQHITKIPHHNSLSASREFFPRSRAYTTEWRHEHHSSLLTDVSHRKGSGVIILHKTMPQYKPPPIAHPPQITTAGDYVSRLYPFLQALVPVPDALEPDFSERAKLAAVAGHLQARTVGPADKRSHNLQITWVITHNTDNNSSLLQHNSTQPCLPEESRHKRGIQLGLLAIHIIAAALEAIGIHIDTIQLDSTSHQILEWTSYAAPRQGYNCLAKHNTDVGKELQN